MFPPTRGRERSRSEIKKRRKKNERKREKKKRRKGRNLRSIPFRSGRKPRIIGKLVVLYVSSPLLWSRWSERMPVTNDVKAPTFDLNLCVPP